MATNFIQIPPDSTGKKIRHTYRIDITLTSPTSDLNLISRGDVVTGGTSGTTGLFVGTETEFDNTLIYITSATGVFIIGESLSTNEFLNVGVVASQLEVYTPNIVISDPDEPFNRMKVDTDGNSYVRFKDGNLGFDTFGHAQMSIPHAIDYHSFIYEDRGPEKYGDVTLIGGTAEISQASSEFVLSTTTSSGSLASRQTHQYYPYTPGIGTEVLMSVRTGTQGQAGTISRWGMFDDNDGLYFQLSGSILSVGTRSKVSGTVVNTTVPQSLWNGDRVENSSTDEYMLDVSKYNLYWIDFAWLGVNRIRFGTYSPTGNKIVLHTVSNINILLSPYSRRGTLPLRLEQYNETSVGSPSQLRLVCASIQQQVETEYKGKVFDVSSNSVAVSGTLVPLISIRPSETFGDKDNRITYFATTFEYIVSGDPVILETIIQPTLTGATFTKPTGSYQSLQIDTDATSISGGIHKGSVALPSGGGTRLIAESFENSVTNFANGTSPTLTFAARTIHPGQTANVFLIVRWKEVH